MVSPEVELCHRVDRGQATEGENFSFQSLVIGCICCWEGVVGFLSLPREKGSEDVVPGFLFPLLTEGNALEGLNVVFNVMFAEELCEQMLGLPAWVRERNRGTRA